MQWNAFCHIDYICLDNDILMVSLCLPRLFKENAKCSISSCKSSSYIFQRMILNKNLKNENKSCKHIEPKAVI